MEEPAAQTPTNPADAQVPIEPAKLKSMLRLPETATDLDLINAMAQVIADLQQKYDALIADTVALQDQVTNRDLADFADVIPEASQDFWRSQLITNRDAAVTALQGIRSKQAKPPEKPAAPPAPPEPLRNRLADKPAKTLSEVTGNPHPDNSRAVAIRNRAAEIRKTEKTSWAESFARAEKEMTT